MPMKPASKAAKNMAGVLCEVSTPTNFERVCTAIGELRSAAPLDVSIKVDDIIEKVHANAQTNQEERPLGPRTTQGVHTALSRLRRNNYIKFVPHRDDIERITISPNFTGILRALNIALVERQFTLENAPLKKHHSICGFFRTALGRKFKPAKTRRELELDNRELEFKVEEYHEHLRTCRNRQRSSSVASALSQSTEIVRDPVDAQEINNVDSMYMDDVLPAVIASPVREQRPQTPIRRSGTLNNPEAYPSPESAPRNLSAQPTTPPGTPTRGRSRSRTPTTPGTFDQDPAGDDDEMDVDIEVPGTSNILFGQNLMTSEQDIQTEDFEAIQQPKTGRLLSRIAWKNWTSFLWKMKYFRLKKDYDDLRSEVDKYKKDHADLRATAMAAVLAMSGPQF